MRIFVVFSHDVLAAALAWGLAFLFRFNFDIPTLYLALCRDTLPWAVLVQVVMFWRFGLYLGIWRFASIPDLRRILIAVGLGGLLLPLLLFMIQRLDSVPRSVLVLDPLLLVLMMGGSRFLYRAWRDGILMGNLRGGRPVMVLGAGDAAANLLKELQRSSAWNVVALLDDDVQKHGRRLLGVNVLGSTRLVGEVAAQHQVHDVIVAMPAALPAERRHAVEAAAEAGLTVHTVPALEELLSGRVTLSQIRRVELEDLLGRDAVQLDNAGLKGLLGERVILVTGAGGSIGSELVRQIANFRPRLLVLLELSEFALYQIEQEFSENHPDVPIACIVGDVKDRTRVTQVFEAYRPAIVFHAAAYKHVPLMEGDNAWEAIRNNVCGSKCVAEISQQFGVEKFVLVSTDKAVNPTNVMGATKRVAERVLGHLQRPEGTRFITVRFGNVLGSNGSVIPKFREQIARGGPVTVTHPDILRYFMLIPEAAQLVLQAGLMGSGGEIFVLEMGEPIRIVDLARDMIRLSGFSEEDIPIKFTGLRPGEKLFEELLTDAEHTLSTQHPKLRVAQAESPPDVAWQTGLDVWLNEPAPISAQTLKMRLKDFVPEYSPQFPH